MTSQTQATHPKHEPVRQIGASKGNPGGQFVVFYNGEFITIDQVLLRAQLNTALMSGAQNRTGISSH